MPDDRTPMTPQPIAVGVDGWKDGWVAATLEDGRVRFHAFPQRGRDATRDAFAALLATFPGATTAVDIPIGTCDGERRSDAAAKDFLRDHRATPSSVFATPTARTVDDRRADLSHSQAMAAAREAGLPGTSIQAWHLIPKMVEVAEALRDRTGAAVHEAHPECSFRALDPRVGASSKKTGSGVARRLRAIRERAGYELDLLALSGDEATVPIDDLLDAVAVLWTAQRIREGTAFTLPTAPGPAEPVITV